MEASVATRAPAEPEQSHDGAAEATRSTEELFKWSGYVHIGGDAEECPHALDGKCEQKPKVDPATGHLVGHFHAWVCLPNAYQIRDVQEKARAARARKVRALRDPESDAGAILESELDDLRRDQMDDVIAAVASRAVDADLYDIIREIQDRDEFENQAHDAEEFQRLTRVPEADRSEEESQDFERLQAQMLKYAETMQEILDARRKGETERLKQLAPERVIGMERDFRVKSIGDETFMFTYYTWVIYVSTRRPVSDGFPMQRVFKEPRDQKDAPSEVVVALREKIRELEQAQTSEARGEAAGNS